MPFGAKPLFESVSATVGNGHRHGPIGASGSGSSTPMKMLSASHLDMETTEALNPALANDPGTPIFIGHDRELVSSLVTRIVELTPDGVNDDSGTYDENLLTQTTKPNSKAARPTSVPH
jgi:ATPase subunit of ABC transporter with duplicated ATPase domains